jgi:uncharacterized protein with NRDE domain
MDTVQKKAVKDFNYNEMEKNKEKELLHRHLKQKDQKIRERDKQLKEVTGSYDGFINIMCTSNRRIHNINVDLLPPIVAMHACIILRL